MRISDNLLIERFLRIHREVLERLEKSSYNVSSGKRLRYPYEDPSGTSQILNLKRSIEEMDRFLENINEGKAWLGITESAFQKLEDYMKRVQELTIQGANDTQNADSRRAIAEELDQIYSELIDVGNTQSMGRYIFAGTNFEVAPFAQPIRNSIKTSPLPAGISIEASEAFSDLYQFDPGNYRLFIKRENNVVKVWMEDSAGNIIQIDSNGSDDTSGGGNVFSDYGTFAVSVDASGNVYGTFDTGRGITISLDGVKWSSLSTVKVIDLHYESGGEVFYRGNSDVMEIQTGYHSFVEMNMPGEGVFKPTKKVIASQGAFEGATETTPWISVDVPTGSEFKLSGRTHDGRAAGNAFVVAPYAVNFERIGTSSGVQTLHFRVVYSSGVTVSSSITVNLPAHYDNMKSVVDTIKALIDANPVLKDKVEVTSQGNYLVFYLLDEGVNYLSVYETDSSGAVPSEPLFGFSGYASGWGRDPYYTVSERVYGKSVVLTSSETFVISFKDTSVLVSAEATTDYTNIYTVETMEPRFIADITAGTTVNIYVGANQYSWQAPSDIKTIDSLIAEWNNSANWTLVAGTGVLPPVAMVREDESHFRLVGRVSGNDIVFSSSETDTLFIMGVSTRADENVYTISYDPNIMTADEYSVLLLAYDINKYAGSSGIEAYTDGRGSIEIKHENKPFDIIFGTGSKLYQAFPTEELDAGGYKASSKQDTLRHIIDKVERFYRKNVEGWVDEDGRLTFRDRLGGKSSFSLNISPVSDNAPSTFENFYVKVEGEGTDLFDVVRDIREAMKEDIAREIIGKPSQWQTVEEARPVRTEIVAMPTGDFNGDYNTTWNVEVEVLTYNSASGTTEIKSPGYSGVFAAEEYELVTSSFTITGNATFIAYLSNGESVNITTSSGITVSSSASVSYRIYLESGTITTGVGTLIINGKGRIAVETEGATANVNDVADVKYINFDGSFKINSSNFIKIDETKKTNLLVTVKDSYGRIVKKFIAIDPYKEYYIRDGVYMAFSSGQVISGDSFNMKVGSGVQTQIGRLGEALDQVLRKHTDIGARVERLDMADNRYREYKDWAEKKKAPIEDVDLTEAVVELQKAENAYRSALMASVRLFRPTLLDFLR